MIHRLFALPMSETNFNDESYIIKTIAVINGYSTKTIIKLYVKKYQKHFFEAYPIHDNKILDEKIISLPYLRKISTDIAKIISNENTVTTYRFVKNLSRNLVNNK